jgi:hypothetical protein
MCVLQQVRFHRPPIWPPALPLNLPYISTAPKLSLGSPPYTNSLHSIIRISYPYYFAWLVYPKNPFRSEVLLEQIYFLWSRVGSPTLNPPSWWTIPCRLSAVAYSIYSQLTSIAGGRSSIRNLRTRHLVVTGTHLTWRR